VTASQNVSWSIAPGTALTLNQNNVLKGSGLGLETITADPAITGAKGTYKINLVNRIPRVTAVTITPPEKTVFRYGEKVTLAAVITKEDGAADGVDWKVVKGADNAAATEAWVFSDGEFEADFTSTDQVVKVIATSKGYGPELGKGLDSAPLEITIKAFAKTDLPKKWTFGTYANGGARIPEGWAHEGGTANTGIKSVAGGMTLNPGGTTASINWRQLQASGGSGNALNYVGCIQSSGSGWSGTIVDYGVPVKVTIVAANTGDGDPSPARHVYIKYGAGETLTSADMPGQAEPDVLSRAFFVTKGEGAISFGSTDGSLRVFEIKVEDPDTGTPLTGITLAETTKTLTPGEQYTLPAVTKVPPAATDDVVWASSIANKEYLTVDILGGKITALPKATTEPIIVWAQKKGDSTVRAEVAITISPVALNSLSVDKSTVSIAEGKTATVVVTKDPLNASEEIEWVSADPAIATVTQAGVITGVAQGSTTVTVQSKTRPSVIKADVAVTVTEPVDNSFWKWKKGDPVFTTTATQFTYAGKALTVQSTVNTTAASGHATAPNGAMIAPAGRIAIGLPSSPT